MSIFDTSKTVHFVGALRCAEQKYNNTFVSHGRIKFGIPQKWVEEGEKMELDEAIISKAHLLHVMP